MYSDDIHHISSIMHFPRGNSNTAAETRVLWGRLKRFVDGITGFGPMAQCVVHALKGLACRASPSCACQGHKNIILFSMGPKLRYLPVLFAGCYACPRGYYQPLSGAQSALQCLPCPFGSYSNTTGASACSTCPVGLFCDVGASTPAQQPLRNTVTAVQVCVAALRPTDLLYCCAPVSSIHAVCVHVLSVMTCSLQDLWVTRFNRILAHI